MSDKTDTISADCGHVRNASATERLRELLDERGVKWSEWKDPNTTAWYDGSNAVRADEYDGHSELLVERVMTPEQVVAATLGDSDATATRQGVGTCVNISNTPSGFLCSECGWGDFDEPSHLLTTAKFTDNDGGPNYCPNCGAKVVDE